MKSKTIRGLAVVAILGFTTAAFVYYFATHHGTIDHLKQLSVLNVAAIIGLYVLATVALAIVTLYSIEVGRRRIPLKENILLTCYSSIINFFGPLQSGPGFRILYLKKRHNISVKDYTFSTFLYYGFFALFSGIFLFVNVLAWWQTTLIAVAIATGSLFVIRKKRGEMMSHYSVEAMVKLALATLLQVSLLASVYFVELHIVNKHITLAQAITYTGAANFALFVSLTPGAIGFRESFLLLSQHLHHISSSQVLAASVIDRAVYIVFLGILFLFSLVFHFSDRLKTPKVQTS